MITPAVEAVAPTGSFVPTNASQPLSVPIVGELTVQTRQAFKQRVVDAITEGRVHIDADLSQCGYVDSSGLGVLVSCAKKCREAGVAFVLCGVTEDFQVLLELTSIASLFTIRRAESLA